MKCIICGKEIEDEKEEIVLPCSAQMNECCGMIGIIPMINLD